MRGSVSLYRRITSAVSSVEALSTRTASQACAVFIASRESSVPRSCPARLRVQMTIETSGLAELMHQPCYLIHRADKPGVGSTFGPGLVERGHLAVQGIEQQMPDAEQAAQHVRVEPVGDHHRSAAEQAKAEGQPLARIALAQAEGERPSQADGPRESPPGPAQRLVALTQAR